MEFTGSTLSVSIKEASGSEPERKNSIINDLKVPKWRL
jgi:hypothetical protein